MDSWTFRGPLLNRYINKIVYDKKNFTKASFKRISLGSLPTRFIKVTCHNGYALDIKAMSVYGMNIQDI